MGVLKAVRGGNAGPPSTVRMSALFAGCEYTSTPGCCCDTSSVPILGGGTCSFALVVKPGAVRSTSIVELLKGRCFRLGFSRTRAPFGPPTACPFGGELMLGGCVISIDVSEVLDELVEFAELASKLSSEVCECGWRAMCPLTLAWVKPNSSALSRCTTTPGDCEPIAELLSGTKEGISRNEQHPTVGNGGC